MIELRPEQEEAFQGVRTALRQYQSVLLQACTGFGKTVVAAHMMQSVIAKGKRAIFCVHRKDLITQTANTCRKGGVPYGYIASGRHPDPFAPIQIASIQTLRNRLDRVAVPDLLVVDEAHLSAAKTFAHVINFYKAKGTKIVGLTATPWRLSGEGLSSLYDVMVDSPSMSWLIENRRLSDYTLYSLGKPDMHGCPKMCGDWIESALDEIMGKPAIVGDAIAHYKKYAYGKRTLAACVSIKTSKKVADSFVAAGVPAVHVDGDTSQEDRMKAFIAFADRKIWVITFAQLFSEGFDLSSQVGRDVPVEALSDMRPTQSLSRYLQFYGRGLRYKDEPCIILDHAGNAKLRHGLPDDEREWSLEGREKCAKGKKQEVEVHVRECPKCFCVHRPAPICPQCGHVYQIQYREVEVKEGELVELDKVKLRRQRSREQSQAGTVEALIELGKKRGYKNAIGWSYYVMESRKRRQRG